jgi:hypothetical protein
MKVDGEPAAESDPPTNKRVPYLDYLLHEVLPANQTEARRLTRRTKSFAANEVELYKWSHTKILQHCPDRTREAAAEGYPWRGLRASCHAQDLGRKRVLTRLLLANRGGGCRADRTHLRRVLILC